MSDQERQSIMTIAVLAAFADGANDDRERKAMQQVASALGSEGGVDFPALYKDVLVGKPDLGKLASQLGSPDLRKLAYEMATAVCDADGEPVAAEREFLERLRNALELAPAAAQSIDQEARDLHRAALDVGSGGLAAGAAGSGAALAGAAGSGAAGSGAAGPAATSLAPMSEDRSASAPSEGDVLGRASLSSAEMDDLILKAAITNAALELLPETLSSMAIIPLQMRLVYRIGRAYGYPMDTSNAKDFIATLGVGLGSQYIEQIGRKLLGGLLGTVAGGLGRGLGRQAASSGLTFATTYAIGRVAQRYYASGRTLDPQSLKAAFASLLEEAKGLMPRYQSQIARTAGTIDTRNLASLLREV
jgi:uncharacterized protein (DUF697 family)/tellurite resistance protein